MDDILIVFVHWDRHVRPAYETGRFVPAAPNPRSSASNSHPESQSEASSQPARFRPDYGLCRQAFQPILPLHFHSNKQGFE
jgi:hypothetical protein